MKNIRITVEYDGTGYAGWQRQAGGIATIQGELETVLSRILQEETRITGAGRTDRGVHARAQMANFFTGSSMELSRLAHSTNSLLSPDIRITGIKEVSHSFHARFDARSREYRYYLIEQPSPLHRRYSGCCHGRPDPATMNELAGMLIGEHDFAAFSKEDPQLGSTICRVSAAEWHRYRNYHVLRIVSDRFLRSMVRFLAAGMIETGRGLLEKEQFGRMLASGDRSCRLVPVEASGLFLWKISYR